MTGLYKNVDHVDSYLAVHPSGLEGTNSEGLYVLFGICGDEQEYGIEGVWTYSDLVHNWY